jgi:hypothetical protein
LQADAETDEVYAQTTLQPTNQLLCKTFTLSDIGTHGGYYVLQRAAEKVFPPLVGYIDLVILSAIFDIHSN